MPEDAASRFEVHWDEVRPPPAWVPPGARLLALWPAPVNADACFADAGFTDFEDHDDAWDARAEALLDHVIERMARFGVPSVRPQAPVPPAPGWQCWFARLRRPRAPPEPLPLSARLAAPMREDSLPACRVDFGAAGAGLRTGDGHWLFWIMLPSSGPEPAAFAAACGGSHPLVHSALQWQRMPLPR